MRIVVVSQGPRELLNALMKLGVQRMILTTRARMMRTALRSREESALKTPVVKSEFVAIQEVCVGMRLRKETYLEVGAPRDGHR